MQQLWTGRLVLREWLPGDAAFVHDLYARWDVQRYIGRVPRVLASRAEAEEKIAGWRARSLAAPRGVWALSDHGGQLLGTILLTDIPASLGHGSRTSPGDVEIGWHLHPDAWGRGYATEAAREVLRHAFAAGLREVVAVTHPDNGASQSVCRRLGMQHEGLTDRYYDRTSELFTIRSACPAAPIRPAIADDLAVLQDIERSAGRLFADIGMPEIAADEPLPLTDLDRHRRAGLAWVAVDGTDRPIGYLVADRVDDALHVEQVSVHPAHSRRGIGRTLLDHAARVAVERGAAALTLTTFEHVPRNAPYYRRCGFTVLDDHDWTPGLRAVRAHEAQLGLDRWPRVCMRRDR